MKRSVYHLAVAGSLNRMRRIDTVLEPPGRQEVTVAVRAIGLNFADTFAIKGLYGPAPRRNLIPGLEFAGDVIACGEEVREVREGDRIMGVSRFGAYATYINLDRKHVTPLPDGWSFEEGASYVVAALTAYYALVPLGNLQNTHIALIHSAAGSVGIFANRIAKRLGAITIGTVGTPSKLAVLEAERCDHGIVRGANFSTRLSETLAGRPLHLVLDCIGGTIQRESYNQLAPTGRLISYGAAQFSRPGAGRNVPHLLLGLLRTPRYTTLQLTGENRGILGFNLLWLYEQVDLLKGYLGEIAALEPGRPLVGHCFPFDRLPEAVRLLQSGTTTGKVVVTVSQVP